MDGKEQIFAWPDGFWCEKHELESYQNERLDDYVIIWIPEEYMHMDDIISEIVENTINHKNNKKLQSDAEGNCPFQKSLPCYHWDKCFNPCGAIPHR